MPAGISDTDLKIANAALVEIGEQKGITSFDDTSLKARTLNRVYDDAVEEALSFYPWRFARAQIELTRSVDDAPSPWDALYDLTDDMVGVVSVWEEDQKIQFDVFGRQVATMTSETFSGKVYAEVTQIKPVADWPPYFRRAFILYLASVIAMPITQDEKTADRLERRANARMKLMQSREAQGRRQSRLDTKAFIRTRRRGARVKLRVSS